MRKLLILLLLFLPALAAAEVHIGQEPPEDWAGRETLRVTILQTGRSDAILVECGGESMLIDGGDASWSQALQHDLEKRGLTDFRYFLNTHPHNDHIEGLTWLMQQGYLPGRFMSPFAADWKGDSYHTAAVKAAWDRGIPFRLIRSGDVFPLGGASIHIWRSTEYPGVNDRCAIQLITFGESRILLCADLTGNAQKALLKALPEGSLTAEIIKAPHHGENAMVQEFLTAADPALILCTSEDGDAPDLARQTRSHSLPLLYSGEGEIVLETDGADWYVVQREKTGRDR
ncbi:MAG: MBL fold metallo-hydrolase [Clostridiales bacterium]|nr:MBL fold metallo-hydrolase [Clostridiales bacterium]